MIQQSLEVMGSVLVGLFFVAQLPTPETSMTVELIKLGSTGVVGIVCILLIRAGERRDKAITDLAQAIDRMIEHCSKRLK
jgi:hypothetical protein